MGYRAQKITVENKMKRWKRIAFSILVILFLGVVIFSFFRPPETWKYYLSMPKIPTREKGELRIHFLDVGQGDCTVIELPDGKVMLIDGGNGSSSTEKRILRYLNALKIDTIDHLLLTHADNDHCGSIDEIVRVKKVLNAYLPASSKTSNGEYAEAYATLVKEKCPLIESSRALDISGNGEFSYTLTFLYPYQLNGETEENNESSAIVWLDYKGVSALFTGDSPIETEEKLIRDDGYGFFDKKGVELKSTEILKVAHHGSSDSSSLAFLQYLNVQTAVLSCGKDNPYGQPAQGVLDNLALVGASVYRTDVSGHVILTVNTDGTYFVKTLQNK